MDPTKQAIYECIQAAFADAGLNAIKSPAQIIVWPPIPEDVKEQIGIFIRGCINDKLGVDPGDLVGEIDFSSKKEPAMPVSDLIEVIFQVMP